MELENLPDHIIHQIMHLLPYEEATKFNVLSKSLYSSWLSFPKLHFRYKSHFSSHVSNKTFSNIVQKTLQLRGPYIEGSLHNLTLSYIEHKKPYSLHYPQVFDVLLNFAIENKVKEVNFDLYIRVLSRQDMWNYSPVNWNYDSLRPLFSSQFLTVLKLKGLQVPLVDALIACPKLEQLVFKFCYGFQTINLSCSSSLKKVELTFCGLKELQILLKGKSLNSFKSEDHEYDELPQCKVDIRHCSAIKVFKFIDATTRMEEFSYSLKKLSLEVRDYTSELNEIVIDVPNLPEFHYLHGLRWFPKLITSAKSSAYVSLLPAYFKSDIHNVRDFLSCFNHFKDLYISYPRFEPMKNVSSLYDVRNLEVEARNGPNFTKLLKSLLKLVPKAWKITLYFRSKKTRNTIKFKYGKKVKTRNWNVALKRWRHYEVDIESEGYDESMIADSSKFFAWKLHCSDEYLKFTTACAQHRLLKGRLDFSL